MTTWIKADYQFPRRGCRIRIDRSMLDLLPQSSFIVHFPLGDDPFTFEVDLHTLLRDHIEDGKYENATIHIARHSMVCDAWEFVIEHPNCDVVPEGEELPLYVVDEVVESEDSVNFTLRKL